MNAVLDTFKVSETQDIRTTIVKILPNIFLTVKTELPNVYKHPKNFSTILTFSLRIT